MSRPRGGDWLEDELVGLRALGVEVLVSMLTADELVELELGDERPIAESLGLRVFELPTPDRGLPDPAAFASLVDELTAELGRGLHVVVHCRMGIGRSSLEK
jgi:protein-tyrosine phosphatase